MSRHEVELSTQVWRVPKALNKGAALYSRRTFPFPHKYILTKPDGTEYASGIAIDTIATLLEHKLIEAHQRDAHGDQVAYSLTQAGIETAEAGSLIYEDENREMFA